MTAESSVVIALLGTAVVTGYFGFELRGSDEPFWQRFSLAFFFVGIIFLILTMGATLLIVQNSGLSYLSDGVVVWGLYTMTILGALVIVFFIGFIFFLLLRVGFDKLAGKSRGSSEYDQK